MQFNSPKNFKKGRLIANRYRPIDLLIAGIAIAMTLSSEMIYLLLMNGKHIAVLATLCIPALIGVCTAKDSSRDGLFRQEDHGIIGF